jgi:Kef-type K+ transport system membrane component KefB
MEETMDTYSERHPKKEKSGRVRLLISATVSTAISGIPIFYFFVVVIGETNYEHLLRVYVYSLVLLVIAALQWSWLIGEFVVKYLSKWLNNRKE